MKNLFLPALVLFVALDNGLATPLVENEDNDRPRPQAREKRSPLSGKSDAVSEIVPVATNGGQTADAATTVELSRNVTTPPLAPGERAGVRAVVDSDSPSPDTGIVRVTPEFIRQLAEEMRAAHPALQAARARTNAAAASVAAVRTWEDPKLLLGGMAAREELSASDGNLLYGVEQKLPLFGKAGAARKVAAAELAVEVANESYEFQILRRDLAKAVFRAALADQTVAIGEQDLAWLDTLVQTMEERYRSGSGRLVDVLSLQNEHAKRAEQLQTDRQNLSHDKLALNRFLNRAWESPWPKLALPTVAGVVVYEPRLVQLALNNEPKLKAMRTQIKQAQAGVEMTRRARLPDVNASVDSRNYSGDGSWRQANFVLSMSLPWVNRDRYRSDLRRDEARLQATEFDAKDYEQSVREEVHLLTVKIDAARREALLYGDQIIPRSEQALASAHALLESGGGMLRDLLDTRRMLLDARLMQARAVAEQYQMLSELVLCCGLGDFEALQMLDVAPNSQYEKTGSLNQ